MTTKQLKVNREVVMWVQDIYKVPENWTEQDVQKANDSNKLDDYFQERDMFALVSIGGDVTETGKIEIEL